MSADNYSREESTLMNLVLFSFAGPEPTLFGKPKFCCMRLHYRNEETSGYFHTLRAATRTPEDDGKGRMRFLKKTEKETFWICMC